MEDDKLDLAKELVEKADKKGINLLLGTDAKIADRFSNVQKQIIHQLKMPDGWSGWTWSVL